MDGASDAEKEVTDSTNTSTRNARSSDVSPVAGRFYLMTPA